MFKASADKDMELQNVEADQLARRADAAGFVSLAVLIVGAVAVALLPNHSSGGEFLLAPAVAISTALGTYALRRGARGTFRMCALFSVVVGALVVAASWSRRGSTRPARR